MSTANSATDQGTTDSIAPPATIPQPPARPATPLQLPSPGQPGLEAEQLEITDCLAKQLRECQAYSVGWLLKAGDYLLETRQELEPGEWTQIFASGRLPIGLRSAQALARIAQNSALSNAKNLRHLPSSISALDELAGLDATVIDQGIRDGKIGPEMTAAQAKAFVRQQRQETKVEQPKGEPTNQNHE